MVPMIALLFAYRKERNIKDGKVENHAERNSSHKVGVLPYRQPEKRLILR
jgi:hypothetical protein